LPFHSTILIYIYTFNTFQHAMIDNIWAHWQGQNDGALANTYEVLQRKFGDSKNKGSGDAWNQGYKEEHKNIIYGVGDAPDTPKAIPAGTPRDFKAEDWMTFFGENDGYGPNAKLGFTGGPTFFGAEYLGFDPTKRKEFWRVQDLLDMRHSFRTYQYYNRAALAAVTEPPPRPT
jgi:hypothetical protein